MEEVIAAGDGLDEVWCVMRDIHVKFDTPAPDEPVLMSPNAVNRRAEWIQEEVDELLEAETIEEQTDAWIDIIVFAVGGLVEQGVVPGPIMSIVLKSQYDKLWEDGQPRFRADGKWIKPPTWTDPKPLIEAEIKRQIDEN